MVFLCWSIKIHGPNTDCFLTKSDWGLFVKLKQNLRNSEDLCEYRSYLYASRMIGSHIHLCPIHYDFKCTMSKNCSWFEISDLLRISVRLHRYNNSLPTRLPSFQRPATSNISPKYPLVFNLACKARAPLLTDSIICYIGPWNSWKYFTYISKSIIKDIIKDKDEWPDEEVYNVKSARGLRTGASFLLEVGCTTLSAHTCVFWFVCFSNPFFRVFMEIPLCEHDWLYHWSLVIKLLLPPFPSLEVGFGGGVCWKVQPCNHLVSPSSNQPPTSDFISTNSGML